MIVPFFDLTRQYKSIHTEIDFAIRKTLQKGDFTLGNEVGVFEREFADYLGADFAVGVGSGTDALTMSMKALDLGAGDEVILPANAYPSAFGIAISGVKIRLVDCDENGLMDVNQLERVTTDNTAAIVPVHLYGLPADLLTMDRFIDSRKKKIYIVEDAAQAHGARIKDSRTQNSNRWLFAGTYGHIGVFSFYPTKNLGAYGDGGMLVTGDYKLDKKLRQLRQYGEKERYQSIRVSGVSRLDEIQAAILRVKLRHLDEWNRRREELYRYYTEKLEGIVDIKIINNSKFKISPFAKATEDKQNAKLKFKKQNYETKPCYHLFVIRTKKRDQLKEYLARRGIGTAIHYPVPVHLTAAFRYLGYKRGDFPIAERLSEEVLSLPLYPQLTDPEVSEVIKQIRKYYR
ncbi:hypothetical protein A2154_00015 [Candidatus Gottesmanbacteria bacterium RBG_16_43_7]|uniref:Erythromycin biosynthesis sensory transduction protein eryC1 n=1 Tax=Candidatus Gottesmanbacteria bacterium RBG_16_43_7 TaxID=1798373 RepID=A0A1F5ZBJ3_9BACT|nr:MAG: hypothetical protein A2154_00015 [Candidatus Gottesmanbacteria bacterium RBG_16_43_7]